MGKNERAGHKNVYTISLCLLFVGFLVMDISAILLAKYVNTRLHVDICVLIVLSFSFCNFVFHSLMGIFIVLYCAFFRLFSHNFILFFFLMHAIFWSFYV